MRWTLLFDVAVVAAFVFVGRDSHDLTGGVGDVLQVAAPFLIGVAVGWIVTRAWSDTDALRTGIGVLAATVVVGLGLRGLVFGGGLAPTFVAVATVFLGIGILGWRMLAGAVRRSRTSTAVR